MLSKVKSQIWIDQNKSSKADYNLSKTGKTKNDIRIIHS